MPIYEYRCSNCGRETEEWQKITDPSVGVCNACGGPTSRLISHSTFVLKGSGWYVTDYARKDGSSCCSSTKAASPTDGASSDSVKPPTSEASTPASSTTSDAS